MISPTITAKATSAMTMMGIPATCLFITSLSSGGALPVGVPLVLSSTMPWATEFMAMVTITGAIPRKVTAAPLIAPSPRPTPSRAGSAQISAELLPPVHLAIITPPRVIIHGIERSIPPVRMTRPCPAAATAMNDAAVTIVQTLSRVWKPGSTIQREAIHSTTIASHTGAQGAARRARPAFCSGWGRGPSLRRVGAVAVAISRASASSA